jgi:hypothetical protein
MVVSPQWDLPRSPISSGVGTVSLDQVTNITGPQRDYILPVVDCADDLVVRVADGKVYIQK